MYFLHYFKVEDNDLFYFLTNDVSTVRIFHLSIAPRRAFNVHITTVGFFKMKISFEFIDVFTLHLFDFVELNVYNLYGLYVNFQW